MSEPDKTPSVGVSREQMGSNVNICVMCGEVIPEGDMVCKRCREEVMGKDEQIP